LDNSHRRWSAVAYSAPVNPGISRGTAPCLVHVGLWLSEVRESGRGLATNGQGAQPGRRRHAAVSSSVSSSLAKYQSHRPGRSTTRSRLGPCSIDHGRRSPRLSAPHVGSPAKRRHACRARQQSDAMHPNALPRARRSEVVRKHGSMPVLAVALACHSRQLLVRLGTPRERLGWPTSSKRRRRSTLLSEAEQSRLVQLVVSAQTPSWGSRGGRAARTRRGPRPEVAGRLSCCRPMQRCLSCAEAFWGEAIWFVGSLENTFRGTARVLRHPRPCPAASYRCTAANSFAEGARIDAQAGDQSAVRIRRFLTSPPARSSVR
jgi:hypothetical protein